MKRLSKLYPVAAEKACSIGNVKIPFRSEGGRSLMMCGMGAFKDVKSLMRLEGQALFPMGVTEKEWQGDAEVGDDLLFGDLTPIVVTVSKWEDSTVGPYSEVQFCNIATYHRMNVPFKRHPYLSPYVLENIPASRLYPMLTITDSPKYAAISTELYHLPTVCRPELNIIEDEKGVKGFSGVEGNTHIPEIVGVDIGVEVGDSSEGLREWGEKWMHVSQTIGLDRLFVNCLEGRRHLKYTIPHGRSTVTGRAINDYKGTRNPLGVVSGVDLKEHAAKCGADYHLVYHNAKNQYTRKWCSTDKATLPSFQPDVIVQTSGLSSIRQLPQPTVLPFHTSDQKRGELNRLSLECSEALASRQPSIEQPDEFREPTPLIDLQKRDRKMQGAQWKG
eukprot:TRINITY_DN4510_c0_g1_i1.p1 TRINITY_DN4510_c0_g1~~TRINITY_DN4510_c0_g1_i1.p1  ORF type:complete len:389 (+),score=96.74 TRINITY_DN4510_c0_g1_i1:34-1200(+)